uniref:Uncharacterized protein n=1 Tax=Rhizophora mucronata TaxID=61149 RepID=A0A2P2PG32_RHIMU
MSCRDEWILALSLAYEPLNLPNLGVC